MPKWIADERLYLNRDKTEVLRDGDPNIASLLCGKGTAVPEAVARQYGLGPYAPSPEPASAAPKVDAIGDGTPPADYDGQEPEAPESGSEDDSGASEDADPGREVVPATLGPHDGGPVGPSPAQETETTPRRRK